MALLSGIILRDVFKHKLLPLSNHTQRTSFESTTSKTLTKIRRRLECILHIKVTFSEKASMYIYKEGKGNGLGSNKSQVLKLIF